MFCLLLTEIWSKILISKGHDLNMSRSYVKINDTIRFLDLKNIDLDTKIVILNNLVQKLAYISLPNYLRYFLIYLKCVSSRYLVLKTGKRVLPIRNWDMTKNVFWKVIGQNKWYHRISWRQTHRSRHQNRHHTCFSSKVMVKDVFLHNGEQRNAYVTRSNRSRYFLIYGKAQTRTSPWKGELHLPKSPHRLPKPISDRPTPHQHVSFPPRHTQSRGGMIATGYMTVSSSCCLRSQGGGGGVGEGEGSTATGYTVVPSFCPLNPFYFEIVIDESRFELS